MNDKITPLRSKTADRATCDVAIWAFLAGTCILLAMAGPFLAGRIYTFDDLGAFHLPIRAFYSEQLAQDRPFDWMPTMFCGYYFTGEGQAGPYHPLHWLLYKFFPLSTALGLEYLLSYPVLWAGAWLFLNRRLHDRATALFGGLLFFSAGFNLLHFPHTNAVAIIAQIPWLLWCIDIVLTDRRRRCVLCATWGIALLTGSQILLGYPQYVWFSLLAEGAYAGFLLYFRRKEKSDLIIRQCGNKKLFPMRAADSANADLCATGFACANSTSHWQSQWHAIGGGLRIIFGLVLGLLIGSVQWLPTLETLRKSTRYAADSTFTSFGSLHPLDLVQLVAPYFFDGRTVGKYTNEFGLYLGAVPLLLVVWLWIKRKEIGTFRPLAVASALFAAAALILALGHYGMVYQLQHYLPGVGNFRGPARYILLFQGGMMLLATLGFFLLVQHYRTGRQLKDSIILNPMPTDSVKSSWKRYRPLWLTVILSAAVALVGLILRGNPHIAPPAAVLAGACLFFYAAWLIVQTAAGNRGALIQLILLTAADLGLYGLSNSIYGNSTTMSSYLAAISVPPGNPPERVVCSLRAYNDPQIRAGDQILLRGYSRADGYLGLEPKKQLDYRRLAALRAAGVRWVKMDPTTENILGIHWRNGDWAEVPQPLPRVRLVGNTVASSNPAADLERINIDDTALTDVPISLPSSAPGTTKLCDDQPGRIVVKTRSDQPQLLVLAESYHPGWTACAGGNERNVYRVNGDFLGCVTGPGAEEIVWQFQPGSLRQGRWLSVLGLGLLPLAAVGLFRKSRRPPALPPEQTEEDGSWHEDAEENEEWACATY